MNLYHYCSNHTFFEIISKKAFWCSALSLSNDSMEGRWVHKVFSDICDQEGLEPYPKGQVLGMLSDVNRRIEGLGFCLSEHSDMLSQWRGYAQNAEGFSIGFSKEILDTLGASSRDDKNSGFSLHKVHYDIATQKKQLEPTYFDIKERIDQGAFRHRSLITSGGMSEDKKKKEQDDQNTAYASISFYLLSLFPRLFQQKNPAFVEEEEWRAVSIYVKSGNLPVKFRAAGDRLIPYRSFDFVPETGIINEVIIGPKNQTPIDIVKLALEKFGYQDVEVKKSAATYR